MGENQVRVYFLCAPVVFNLVQFFLLGKRLNVKPVTARQPMKLARTEARERRRTEIDEKRKKQHELEVLQKAKEEESVQQQQRVSTLDMPHYDLGQTTESSDGIVPLPRAINDMFQQEEVVVDDPALHEGRSRSFTHQANSWATYIYLDTKAFDLEEARELLVKELDLEPIPNPHMSLSKVVSLRHHWLQPLTASLHNSLGQERKFYLGLDKLQVYVNDECSRTFVGLTAGAGWGQLSRITKRVDSALQEYNLPPFYRSVLFQLSLAHFFCSGRHLSTAAWPGVLVTVGRPSFQDCKSFRFSWLTVLKRTPFLSMLFIARLETSISASSLSDLILFSFAHFFYASQCPTQCYLRMIFSSDSPELGKKHGNSVAKSDASFPSRGPGTRMQSWPHDASSKDAVEKFSSKEFILSPCRGRTLILSVPAVQGCSLTRVKGAETTGGKLFRVCFRFSCPL